VSDWRIHVRNPELENIGIVDVWETLRAELRLNAGGTWSITLPSAAQQAHLFEQGHGVVVWGPGGVVFSGPMREPKYATSDDGAATLTVSGIDDTARLAFRLCYPDPTSPSTEQTEESHYVATGPAETVIRNLINANAGPGALPARRISGLNLGPDLGRGTTVRVEARFTNLLEQCTELAATGGVRFWIEQDNEQLVLKFSEPVTSRARFSPAMGNLLAHEWSLSAPTATRVLVAGQGDLTERQFVERADADAEDAWAERIEVFQDARDTSEDETHEQRGDAVLAEAAGRGGLSSTPVDVPGLTYAVDYNLGDIAEVDLGEITVADTIAQISIDGSASGVRVRPIVGGTDPDAPAIYKLFRQLRRRTDNLERST